MKIRERKKWEPLPTLPDLAIFRQKMLKFGLLSGKNLQNIWVIILRQIAKLRFFGIFRKIWATYGETIGQLLCYSHSSVVRGVNMDYRTYNKRPRFFFGIMCEMMAVILVFAFIFSCDRKRFLPSPWDLIIPSLGPSCEKTALWMAKLARNSN